MSDIPRDVGSAASSSGGTRVKTLSAGDTRFAESANLSARREKATSREVDPNSYDGNGDYELTLLSTPDQANMSRAPLLMRSSPALGTGSYGGLPILSLSSSPDSDDHHVTSALHNKKKGKSKLRHSEPIQSRALLNRSNSHGDSIPNEPVYVTSRARRRSTKDGGSSSGTLDGILGDDGLGLESPFTTAAGTGASQIFEPLHSSSSSSQAGKSDELESSETEDLHDIKSNAHPSDNSPYAQVRASVAATDDLSLSINTPRMWALSIFFAILGSSTNLFFSLRYPSVSITPIIALLLVHPLGLLWDQALKRPSDPVETFINGAFQHDSIYTNGSRPTSRHDSQTLHLKDSWRRQLRLWLARGRWNEKEHCCVYISSNVSFGFAFATDVSMPH
jgi:hypothetical protein